MRRMLIGAALAVATLFAAVGLVGAPASAAPLTTGVAGAVQTSAPPLAEKTQFYYGGGPYYRRPYYGQRYYYRRPYYARRYYAPRFYGRRCFTRPRVVLTPYGYRRRFVRICR